MKKIILISAICAICTQAQSQSWSITGNTGTTGSNFIGTTDNVPFKIRTKNVVRITVNGSGKVGIGISSPVFKLDVKGGSINTDSVYRIGGNTVLSVKGINNFFSGNLAGFSNTSGSNNMAVGNQALYLNTTGTYNTAIGTNALFFNVAGYAGTAIGYNAMYYANNTSTAYLNDNTAVGYEALKGSSIPANNTGTHNTALGYKTLLSNTVGFDNIAIGYNGLFYNTTGFYNVACGSLALVNNTTGAQNTAIGSVAMVNNQTGTQNAAFGYHALHMHKSGNGNTALGTAALQYDSIGNNNTAVGHSALQNNKKGSFNTALGYGAGSNVPGFAYNNSMALGYSAVITDSNQVRVGNASVASIGGYVGWTTLPSDSRFKMNIQENVPGIEFIKKLRPVTYNLDVKSINSFLRPNENNEPISEVVSAKEKIVYTGFIAQEVEQAAKDIGYDFSGVDKPQNENSVYGLRYAEFVVPLVKSMQELTKENELLKNEIQSLKNNFNQLSQKVASVSNNNYSNGFLGQNIPNPFNENTTIPFVLPNNFASASIKIINSQTSQTITEYQLSSNQTSQEVNLNLSNGIYSYSLIIDGVTVDTKQMVNLK